MFTVWSKIISSRSRLTNQSVLFLSFVCFRIGCATYFYYYTLLLCVNMCQTIAYLTSVCDIWHILSHCIAHLCEAIAHLCLTIAHCTCLFQDWSRHLREGGRVGQSRGELTKPDKAKHVLLLWYQISSIQTQTFLGWPLPVSHWAAF